VDYFRLFYEYIEEKVSDFLFVKSGSVIIFFWYNLVANFSREYAVPFLRNFHWGGGQNREKRQNEKYEPSRFGERASLKRDFVKL
jgi:hypothetical protein